MPWTDPETTATREAAEERVLQYLLEATTGRTRPVPINKWLLQYATDLRDVRTECTTIRGIEVNVEPADPWGDVPYVEIDVEDPETARDKLAAMNVTLAGRCSNFTYAENWPDNDQAIEDANAQLSRTPKENSSIPMLQRVRKGLRFAIATRSLLGRIRQDLHFAMAAQRTAVQNEILRHAANVVAVDSYWFAIDTWMMEQSAIDARHGCGQLKSAPASRWAHHEAEFEVEGIWLRIEHRDHDVKHLGVLSDIGLSGHLRILNPETARRQLKVLELLPLDCKDQSTNDEVKMNLKQFETAATGTGAEQRKNHT